MDQEQHPTIYGYPVRLQLQLDDGTWAVVPNGLIVDFDEGEMRVQVDTARDVILAGRAKPRP